MITDLKNIRCHWWQKYRIVVVDSRHTNVKSPVLPIGINVSALYIAHKTIIITYTKLDPHGLNVSTAALGLGLVIWTVMVRYVMGVSLSTSWHSLISGTVWSGIHKYGYKKIDETESFHQIL